MINQNWWFTTLLVKPHQYCPPLNKDIKCDVLIVGGGFSGISAAAEFLGKGLSVVLIEKNIVGGSSAGRSAGFLTPDSELELHQLVRRYGIFRSAQCPRRCRRGLQKILPVFFKPPAFHAAHWVGEHHRQAGTLFHEQWLGEVLSGGHASKTRGHE
jgi:gamma-glutamylputrescine oxidase